ncbi:programmed cell death 1 ligand 1-like isoform X2 [Hyperolius riggenbachi]
MDISVFLLGVYFFCSLFAPITALFTVQAINTVYTAEYEGDVAMECQFPVKPDTDIDATTVIWKHKTDTGKDIEVATFFNGKEADILQKNGEKGRVKLLSQELSKGRAILRINKLKITDAGQYLCIISSQGSDYKTIQLEVKAPYKEIHRKVRDVVTSSGQRVKEISCQSVGYPEAEVTWLNDSGSPITVYNTTSEFTADKLYSVTSVIRVSSAANRNFTCTFWNEAYNNKTSLTFTISETERNQESSQWIYAVTVFVILIILAPVTFLINGRCKRRYKENMNFYNSKQPRKSLHGDNCATTSTYHDDKSEHEVLDVFNT